MKVNFLSYIAIDVQIISNSGPLIIHLIAVAVHTKVINKTCKKPNALVLDTMHANLTHTSTHKIVFISNPVSGEVNNFKEINIFKRQFFLSIYLFN